jgi:hypothetical protein
MKKLGILLVVLAICLPAYGYILVYKVTTSGTSADFYNDPNGWLLDRATRTGYLVLDVDDSDPNILNDVQYIDYRTFRLDGSSIKLYDIFTSNGNFSQTIMQGQPPRGKNIADLNADLVNGDSSIQLTGLLLGNTANTDIGTLTADDPPKKAKVNVATNPKGFCQFITGELLGDPNEFINGQGGGTISATLDSKWTKTANNPDDTKGFAGDFSSFVAPDSNSPQGLLNWLINTGKYTSVAP